MGHFMGAIGEICVRVTLLGNPIEVCLKCPYPECLYDTFDLSGYWGALEAYARFEGQCEANERLLPSLRRYKQQIADLKLEDLDT